METEKLFIDKIEQRMWQLMLLAVVIILYLTLALLAVHFLGFLPESQKFMVSKTTYKYAVFLSVLILLFCIYMIIQQRKLLQLSRSFFREKETSDILRQNVKILSSLLEVSSSINSQHNLSDILNTIATEILSCFQADQSSIMLLDQQSGMLKTQAAFGKGSQYTKDVLIPIGKSIAGWVIKTGKPVILNGQVDPSEFPGTPKKNRSISSSMCVPLIKGTKSIGVLNVNLIDRDRIFSETDLQLINIFSNNAAIAIHNAMLSEERNQRMRLQTLFEQLHSPQVVQELIKKSGDSNQPQRMRKKLEITILFADIRGFSSLLSALEMEKIMVFLDAFYSAMTKAVFDNEGTLDKFIGDEVMAFFGAPLALKNSSQNGLKTAKEMLASFHELKKRFIKISSCFEELGLGIGVNTGEVFIGNVGSTKRYEYTVIGDSVNLAKRLCTNARSDQILTTKNTLSKLPEPTQPEFFKTISFKGIPEPVHIY